MFPTEDKKALPLEEMYPTPASRDYKGARKPETMAKTGRNPETNSLPDKVEFKDGKKGRLNPEWVESLMGYETNWTHPEKDIDTSIGFTGTESWHDGTWEKGLERVTEKNETRANRIKALGNSIVPEIPKLLGQFILEVEKKSPEQVGD